MFMLNLFVYFRFPLNDKERLNAWVHAVRRENFKPTKYSRLCSEHFLAECYEIRPNINVPYLKKDAVPSVFKGFPPHLQKPPPRERSRKRREPTSLPSTSCTTDVEYVEEPPVKKARTSPLLPARVSSPTKAVLRNKIKVLKQKLRRKVKKISSLKQLLDELTKRGLLENDPKQIIEHHFDGTLRDLLKNELINQGRAFKGRRYSRELKQFAFTLMYYSPKAYRFCR